MRCRLHMHDSATCVRWSLRQHTLGTAQGKRTVEWLFVGIQLCSFYATKLPLLHCLRHSTCLPNLLLSARLPVWPVALCCVSKISCRWYSIISCSHFYFISTVVGEPTLSRDVFVELEWWLYRKSILRSPQRTSTRTPFILIHFFFFIQLDRLPSTWKCITASVPSKTLHLHVHW